MLLDRKYTTQQTINKSACPNNKRDYMLQHYVTACIVQNVIFSHQRYSVLVAAEKSVYG